MSVCPLVFLQMQKPIQVGKLRVHFHGSYMTMDMEYNWAHPGTQRGQRTSGGLQDTLAQARHPLSGGGWTVFAVLEERTICSYLAPARSMPKTSQVP